MMRRRRRTTTTMMMTTTRLVPKRSEHELVALIKRIIFRFSSLDLVGLIV